MKPSLLLSSAILCGSLAACSGFRADYAESYDPHLLKDGTPISVAVVGAPGNSAALKAAADELRLNGVAASENGVGSNYRLTIVYGAAADNLTSMARVVDDPASKAVCPTINNALASSTAQGGGMPVGGGSVAAALCHGNDLLSFAHQTNSGPAQIRTLVHLVVPASNWRQYTDTKDTFG